MAPEPISMSGASIEFRCLRCGECCRRLLIGSRLIRKGLPLFPDERGLFPGGLIKPGVGIGHPDKPDFRVISYQMTEMVCPHLDEGSCGIWEARPVVCRTYPYMPVITQGGYVTKEASLECTSLMMEAARRHGVFKIDEGSLEGELRALEKLSRITVEAVENLDEAWFYDLRGERWIRFERLRP
ncbi:YkgJ family cysteine cluster protein [Candidatus Bathyarchaeota archaeon]|nr:YkgJ family cysteine cluster protein [Candidatus Bathyarchaeota archaeon]